MWPARPYVAHQPRCRSRAPRARLAPPRARSPGTGDFRCFRGSGDESSTGPYPPAPARAARVPFGGAAPSELCVYTPASTNNFAVVKVPSEGASVQASSNGASALGRKSRRDDSGQTKRKPTLSHAYARSPRLCIEGCAVARSAKTDRSERVAGAANAYHFVAIDCDGTPPSGGTYGRQIGVEPIATSGDPAHSVVAGGG